MLIFFLVSRIKIKTNYKKVKHFNRCVKFFKKQPANLYIKKRIEKKGLSPKYNFLLPVLLSTKPINTKYMSNVWLANLYFRSLMHTMTGFYTNWQFMNINTLADRDEFAVLWYRIYKRYRLGKLYTTRGTFFAWFVQLTYFKDPKFLIVFIKKILLNSQLKHHRRMFSFINKFLKLWYLKVAKLKKVKGYSLFFKGKLGKKGSVRKAKFFAKRGLVSFTNKSLRVNYRTYFIWTHTGVIGAGISVFY